VRIQILLVGSIHRTSPSRASLKRRPEKCFSIKNNREKDRHALRPKNQQTKQEFQDDE
jgi:hypothetical protein